MATVVLTVIGADRSGLVSDLSASITAHGGNWERSQLGHLAGRFAGIVEVSVADERCEALVADLMAMDSAELHVSVERSVAAEDEPGDAQPFLIELLGNDRPGIVAEVSAVLAAHDVGIEELVTEVRDAPMAGGTLFEARAIVVAPPDGTDALRKALEGLADELMVDLTLTGS